ncbi:MAG: hypothetical protein JWM16_6328 [Verrucomicrobiales bacterium]|nr:hypothetical protein [Verrucomicrobiales bacterium]
MIWFALVPVVFFFAVREFMFDSYMDGFLDRFMGFVMSLVISLIAAGISAGAAVLCGLAFQSSPVKVGEYPLVAIRTKDGIEGQFFLGTGFIQSDQYYFWYRQLPNGGFQPGKTYAGSGVTVYEEDRKDAVMVTWQWQLNQPWAWWVSIPTSAGGTAKEFHVPTGTILKGYSM